MFKLGLGLQGYTPSAIAFDSDAAAFFATAGVTDATAKTQINSFVKGIKDLGLWSSMVCWPLRSSQNAGTGTTAYSLGGLATYNGTLTNGPTWGTDGIIFDGTNDRIALANGAFGTGTSPASIFCILKTDSTATKSTPFSTGDGNTNAAVVGLNLNSSGFDVAFVTYTGQNIAAQSTDYKCLLVGNTNLGFSGKNGGTVISFTPAVTLTKPGNFVSIGSLGNPFQEFFGGIISAVIRFNQTPTTQLNSDVYTLYKTTLGQGLGLP